MLPTKCGISLIPDLWEITHNPWVVLQTVSRDQIERVLGDPGTAAWLRRSGLI
jgi:hypothetical protein